MGGHIKSLLNWWEILCVCAVRFAPFTPAGAKNEESHRACLLDIGCPLPDQFFYLQRVLELAGYDNLGTIGSQAFAP